MIGDRFRLGVNYWPAEAAMAWLPAYDPGVVRRDFARIAAAGMDTVRIFVRWEDVQPTAATLDRTGIVAAGEHTVSLSLDVRNRFMTGSIETHPIDIQDDAGRLMRFIRTAQVPRLAASDTLGGFGVRDLWTPTARMQVDLNVRADFPTFGAPTIATRGGWSRFQRQRSNARHWEVRPERARSSARPDDPRSRSGR